MGENNKIEKIFESSSNSILDSKKLSKQIENSITLIIKSINNGNKIVLFGNGGSAADAQHMAAEFIGRFMKERKSFPAIALSTDSSIITAIGNDYSFEKIFSRQAESLVKKGDVIIAISTSGESKNILEGIKTSKKIGAKIISLTGENGIKMKKNSDIFLNVPSTITSRIQEVHRTIIHIICEMVEDELSKRDK
jgi:D-sedoheptulose 7-phosphate isomerase|tara:strand:+ start:364 stop:945 length:582 start_codon:yes stop_codon:yes gene_type:complete